MKKFYTNGVKTIKLSPDDIILEGYHLGRTFNKNPWNKGLTKNDPRVRLNTEKCHKTRKEKQNYHSWNKGLTKSTNASLKRVSEAVAKARKENPYNEEQLSRMCEHIIETKRKNNSFHTSKSEDQYYEYLLSIYDKEDIIRQYRDNRYPFNCDFYIKSEDLFIECNYSWVHMNHPYNESDENDKKLLAEKYKKAENSNYHKYAIKVWTESDVLKLKTFRENKLNFMIIYPNDLIIRK